MDPDAVRAVDRVVHGGRGDDEVIDFSANHNPLVPEGVGAVYQAAFERARSYPAEPPADFQAAAAEYLGSSPDEIVGTAGGLEAIRLAIEITVRPGDSVVVPYPSFGEYAREVRLQGAEPAFVPHDELLATDPAGHALAIVCHPNNPTGDAYDDDHLRSFASRCLEGGTPLLVDEAFLGFTERPSLAGRDGVIVARSLTKLFGLPGLRAGFAVATGDLLERLAAARPPWNLGTPARAVGTYCLRQNDFVEATRNRVHTERERLRKRLATRFEVHPSESPFLLLDLGDRSVAGFVRALRDRNVLVRDATTFRGLDSHVRLAVRLPEQNDRLLEAIDDV